jgi:septal ring factor EnvC (AmiA/AmiB activator)
MSENDTNRLIVMIEALDAKVEALNAKFEARLRDTTPMWEIVVSRLDTIVAEQASQGRRLDAVEKRLDGVEKRLDGVEKRLDGVELKLDRLELIESELRHLRRRIEGMIGELSRDVVEVRAAQRDLEARLEKPPA